MNYAKPVVVLVILGLFSCFSVLAQVKPTLPKTYLVWVKLKDNPAELKGIFHEITDSSIFVSHIPVTQLNSEQILNPTEYKFNKIDLLRTRKTNSLRNNAILGGTLGFLGGAIPMIVIMGEDLGAYSAIPAVAIGTYAGAFGLVIGGFAGSVRDRIPNKRQHRKL